MGAQRTKSPLEELFDRVVDALDEQMQARGAEDEVREAAIDDYRREWEQLLNPREDFDEIREAGDWRIRVARRGMPHGWVWVMLTAYSGESFYTGLLREKDIPLEMVVQIERARQFNAAERELGR